MEILPQPPQKLIGVQQSQRAQNTQKAQPLPRDGGKEGQDCRNVSPGGYPQKNPVVEPRQAEPDQEIREDHEAENHIHHLDPAGGLHEGGGDDEKDRHDIEGEKPVPEDMRAVRVVLIELSQQVQRVSPAGDAPFLPRA